MVIPALKKTDTQLKEYPSEEEKPIDEDIKLNK